MKHIPIKFLIGTCLVFLLAFAFSAPSVSVAQQNTTGNEGGGRTGSEGGGRTGAEGGGRTGSEGGGATSFFYLQNPLKFNSVGGIINGFLDIFIYLVILLAVVMIIYVGLRFVLAMGNTEELKTRKNQLLWLLVGVAIVIGARILVSAVINTLDATGIVQPGVINNARDTINGR